MYAKPKCSPLVKALIVVVIAVELAVIGFLCYRSAQAEGGATEAALTEATEQAPRDGEGSEGQNDALEADGKTVESGQEEEKEGSADDGQNDTQPVQLTVTFAGDCTLGSDVNYDGSRSFNSKYAEVDDPTYFLKNVADIFADDDLTIVNMEGVLTEDGARQDKEFSFRGKPEYAKILSSASVEAASVANNHSQDYGEQSLEDTKEALAAENIDSFGYDTVAYEDVQGVKVALVGTYTLKEGVDYEKEMTDNIAAAKKEGAQLVLVYVHWGVEKDTVPGEDQMKLARTAIDAGADLVVGSHPHVIQGWEVYKGRYIVYSLGNFCFGGNTNPADKDCMIFQQTFTVTGDEVAKDDEVKFIACSVSSDDERNNYQPTPAEGDEKDRIDAKIQESTDEITELAKKLDS